jgi:hypothetical protein
MLRWGSRRDWSAGRSDAEVATADCTKSGDCLSQDFSEACRESIDWSLQASRIEGLAGTWPAGLTGPMLFEIPESLYGLRLATPPCGARMAGCDEESYSKTGL